jgi:hypothetical protein
VNNEERARFAEFLDQSPWGDIDRAIYAVEMSLRLLLDATREQFLMWEAEADARGFHDEFSLTPDEVRDLSDESRLAYVGRLVMSLALNYGLDSGRGIGEDDPHTPAGSLHALNDIDATALTSERDIP